MSNDVMELERSDPGAPIVLVTGLPGAGKTLFALAEFAVGKKDVYQVGIPGCALPTLDPKKWQDLPAGSTVIMDEAQEIFPPLSPTATPPAHYIANRIRHKGISLVLLTQHPNMLDSRVRRLAGRHIHMVQAFGMDAAMKHEWIGKIGDVDTRADSQSALWKYPKAVYKLYKSADMHRARTKIPLKLKLIPVFIIAAIALVIAGMSTIFRKPTKATEQANAQAGHAATARYEPKNEVHDAAWYTKQFAPRVPGLAYTAPHYEQVTQAVRAPIPVACVSSKSRCTCYTQQATRLDMPDALCRQIVANGFFVDFDDADAKQRNAMQVRSSDTAASAPPTVLAAAPVEWPASPYGIAGRSFTAGATQSTQNDNGPPHTAAVRK